MLLLALEFLDFCYFIVVLCTMKSLALYKLPVLDSIQLIPIGKCERNLQPSILHRTIEGKAISFKTSEVRLKEGSRRSIKCTIEIKTSLTLHSSFCALFEVDGLEKLPDLTSVEDLVLLASVSSISSCENEIPQECYGAMISSRTQIILVNKVADDSDAPTTIHREFQCFEFSHHRNSYVLKTTRRTKAKTDNGKGAMLMKLHSIDVTSSVMGYMEAIVGQHAAITWNSETTTSNSTAQHIDRRHHRHQKLTFGSLLLTGPSGTGCTTLVTAAAALCAANVLTLSAGTLYARAPAGQGSVSGLWARRQVHEVVMCALALKRCVLVLDDLHFLAPRRGGSTARHTEAENGIIEVSKCHIC